jgi:hypothetical protein
VFNLPRHAYPYFFQFGILGMKRPCVPKSVGQRPFAMLMKLRNRKVLKFRVCQHIRALLIIARQQPTNSHRNGWIRPHVVGNLCDWPHTF